MSILVSLCKSLPFCRPHFALVCPWEVLPVDMLPLLDLLQQLLSSCSIVLVRMGQVPAMGLPPHWREACQGELEFQKMGQGLGVLCCHAAQKSCPSWRVDSLDCPARK